MNLNQSESKNMYTEQFYTVYILCSRRNGTLYVGVTNNLIKRVFEHKSKLVDGFTKKYNVDKLVYYELYESVADAIGREKKIKHYTRSNKIALIEGFNPEWKDLYNQII